MHSNVGASLGFASPPVALSKTSRSRYASSLVCSAAPRRTTVSPVETQKPQTRVPEAVRSFLSRAPGNSLENLLRADGAWTKYRETVNDPNRPGPKQVVHTYDTALGVSEPAYDVIVCGGTLGIFLATALQRVGRKVAVVEQGPLKGREQDWNISRDELVHSLTGVLTEEEIESVIVNEFNPMRIAFPSDFSTEVHDVLNIGVSPEKMIRMLRDKFVERGGDLYEFCAFKTVDVFTDTARVTVTPRKHGGNVGAVGAGGSGQFAAAASSTDENVVLTGSLMIDCMGNFSPVAAQARGLKARPDAVCMVVGSCSDGLEVPESEKQGDLMVSVNNVDVDRRQQYFWESFPATDGRTTYMFAYASADPERPSLVEVYDDYLKLLPEYGNKGGAGSIAVGDDWTVDEMDPKRVFFGFFPAYKQHSPLSPVFNRVMQVGDASGLQSPLSFGGFGSLMRHLSRLTTGIDQALMKDSRLEAKQLKKLVPYQPNLAVTWLFQKAMSVPVKGEVKDPAIISKVLSNMFTVMAENKDKNVMMSFVRDVVQFGPLGTAILGLTVRDISLSLAVLGLVGPVALAEWTRHFVALGMYDVLSRIGHKLQPIARRSLPSDQLYAFERNLEAWTYGSGRDAL